MTQEIEIARGSNEPVVLPKGPRRGDFLTITVDRLDEKGTGVATFPALIGPQQMPRTYKATMRKAVPGDRVHREVAQEDADVSRRGSARTIQGPHSAKVSALWLA